MKRIIEKNPENTKNYLKPTDRKLLLIMTGIKLVLALAGSLMMPIGEYSLPEKILLRTLMFAFVYDICCLYQVSLHIAQSFLIAFLLFLVLLLGGVFLFDRCSAFLASINPSTAAGENLSMAVMTLVFFIPFLIDVIRLIRLSRQEKKVPPGSV